MMLTSLLLLLAQGMSLSPWGSGLMLTMPSSQVGHLRPPARGCGGDAGGDGSDTIRVSRTKWRQLSRFFGS